MDGQKLLIADSAEEFRTNLAEALQGAYYVRTCKDGQEALSLLRSFRPDILVLDLMLPGLDGISLLQNAVSGGICPMVLATVKFLTPYICESAERLGIEYLMVKPCDIRGTVARIGDLSQRIRQPLVSTPDPRTYVSNLLVALGVPTKLRGYPYLREAILLIARNRDQSITKELYPTVAAACGDRGKNIERSIRTAIDKAWQNRDNRIWQMYFPPGPDGVIPRPSNAAFISRLADSLLLQRECEIE